MHSEFAPKPGDVVTYDLADYVVESRTAYRGAALTWYEWILNSGAGARRLSVVAIRQELLLGGPCEVAGQAGAGTVEAEGGSFRLEFGERVDVETSYESGPSRFDRADYWYYAGDEGNRLIVCRSHGTDRSLLLAPVDPVRFEVYGA